jgi:hypothetical protein
MEVTFDHWNGLRQIFLEGFGSQAREIGKVVSFVEHCMLNGNSGYCTGLF